MQKEESWLSLETIKKWEPLAQVQGVSEVARSPRGFLTQYKRVKGKFADLSEEWRKKRNAFIARHGAQMSREQLYDKKGNPTRRHLALIMWAYSPDAKVIARAKPVLEESVIPMPILGKEEIMLIDLGQRFLASPLAQDLLQEPENLPELAGRFCVWLRSKTDRADWYFTTENIELNFGVQAHSNFASLTDTPEWITSARAKTDSSSGDSYIDIFFSPNMFASWHFLLAVGGTDYVQDKWSTFISRNFMPTMKHELTHVFQRRKEWLNSRKFTDVFYQKVYEKEGYSQHFWEVYFGDKLEIMAHAREAIETANALGIDNEDMLEKVNTLSGISWLIDQGVKALDPYTALFQPSHPVRKRFFKTLVQTLEWELTESIDSSVDEKIVKRKGKYCVIGHKTKRKFGCYNSKEDAQKRLRQIQYFAHRQNASIEHIHSLLNEDVTEQKAVEALLGQSNGHS